MYNVNKQKIEVLCDGSGKYNKALFSDYWESLVKTSVMGERRGDVSLFFIEIKE